MEFQWISMDSMDSYEFLWKSYGFQWIPMDSDGLLLEFLSEFQ